MNKVLIISYFWPPSGKATVHWPLFISKHLQKYGWMPIILTVNEDSFSSKDYSLLKEVDSRIITAKTKSFDPFNLYRLFLNKNKNEDLVASETISLTNKNWKHRFSIWIRMNLFVPDARIGWRLSAVKAGAKLIETEKPNIIISIGPPHSSHLIGKKLSEKYKIPHVPVLIDPWVDIVYYKNFKRNKIVLALDNYFERSVLNHAKNIIFVTKNTKDNYVQKYSWIKDKSHVLYWGYNEEYFTDKTKIKSQYKIILHAGNIFDYQNPIGLWKNIKLQIDKGEKIKLRFVGTVSPQIKNAITDNGLLDYTEFVGFLPYNKVVEEMLNAEYLLVCATEKRHLPGKLFEYLRTGNKIIAFGDDNNEISELLEQNNSGILFPYNYDKSDIFELIDELNPNITDVKNYSRSEIARQLVGILNKCIM